MNENKSKYVFLINEEEQVIHKLVQDFLSAYGFVQKTEGDEIYYLHKNWYYGKQFFEYNIEGNKVTVWAYVGSYKNPDPLDDSYSLAVAKINYYDKLITLFNKLIAMNSNMTEAQQSAVNVFLEQHKEFMEGADKSKGKMVVLGFVLAIIFFVVSLFGTLMGLGVIMQVYFAICGMKSSKKGLAISTLVITAVTVIVFIMNVIFYSHV